MDNKKVRKSFKQRRFEAKELKQNKRSIRNKKIVASFNEFFRLKFLRTKRYLAVSKNRATAKAVITAILWLIPLALVIVAAFMTAVAGSFAGAQVYLALAALALVILYLFAPKSFAALRERFVNRHKLFTEKQIAYADYTNAKQERITRKMSKKHSKYSKKGSKGLSKIEAQKAKEAKKAAKRKAKQDAKEKALKEQSAFVGKIQLEKKSNENVEINKL